MDADVQVGTAAIGERVLSSRDVTLVGQPHLQVALTAQVLVGPVGPRRVRGQKAGESIVRAVTEVRDTSRAGFELQRSPASVGLRRAPEGVVVPRFQH